MTEISQDECHALVAIYNKTDGDSWSNNSGWLQTDTPCLWFGVTCNNGGVSFLTLHQNQLKGSIPLELEDLVNLRELNLDYNQLSGSIPPELGNLVNLQSLEINSNQLNGVIPSELRCLSSLQSLHLFNNQLSAIPPELGGLANLESLNLGTNQLTESIPPELGNLSKLKRLDLSKNQFNGSIPPELGTLVNLQQLLPQSNQLEDSIPHELGNLVNLQYLTLDRNQLDGHIPSELGNLVDLDYLYLGWNQLSGNIPPALGNLTKMWILDLRSNQLNGSIPPALGDLNLGDLNLGYNQLSGSIPKELGNISSLRSLYLNNNQISGPLPHELGRLTHLQSLFLRDSTNLSGPLPLSLMNLSLIEFYFQNTNLCEPQNPDFQLWLDGIPYKNSSGIRCQELSAPVIFVHGWQGLPGSSTIHCSDGITRYDDPDLTNNTFGDMTEWFSNAGYDVWIAHLDTGPLHTPPIQQNAQCLQEQISQVHSLTNQKVTLVAHGMGGLVTRTSLNLYDCSHKVSALFTLGTPHAGINGLFLLKTLTGFDKAGTMKPICETQPALCQFSTDSIFWFNFENPNQPGITYNFLGGDLTPFPLGWLLWPFDGPNDGMVGNHSAVGWLHQTQVNAVSGPEAGRYWTNETHTNFLGYPSYFDASNGPDSQAFRCVAWLSGTKHDTADCIEAGSNQELITKATPQNLYNRTIDVNGYISSYQNANHSLEVDTSDPSIFHLSWVTGTLTMTLTQPNGQVISPDYAISHPDEVSYYTNQFDELDLFIASYVFTNTIPGL